MCMLFLDAKVGFGRCSKMSYVLHLCYKVEVLGKGIIQVGLKEDFQSQERLQNNK